MKSGLVNVVFLDGHVGALRYTNSTGLTGAAAQTPDNLVPCGKPAVGSAAVYNRFWLGLNSAN